MVRIITSFFVYYLILFHQNALSQHYNNHLVVPKFIVVPERQSFYSKSDPSSSKLQLLCASWPPNSQLSLVDPKSYLTNDESSPTRQKYALLRDKRWDLGTVSYPSVDEALQNFTSSIISDTMISRSTSNSMGMQITMTNGQNIYGNFQPSDLELHCLTKTNLGGLLSSPFLISEASLGKYSNELEAQRGIEEVEFLTNNIAFFDCHLPENSKPEPIVKFMKNNMDLYINPDRHLTVKSLNGSIVTLLIYRFDKSDEGIYECSIENPITKEKIVSPIKKKLKVNAPTSILQSKLRRDHDGLQEKKLIVKEGQNVTLFCVIESAPPPDISTAPYNMNNIDPRLKYHNKFGAFSITNVQQNDTGMTVICSDRKLSFPVRLEVIPKLRMTKFPTNKVIRSFDQKVQFDCETSDNTVTPEWYFNGSPIQSGSSGGPLIINNVQRRHLGIYQCVAKKIGPNGEIEEWVSESAILSHESERLIKTADELASLIPKNMTESTLPTPSITTQELTPECLVINDHLFALINWTAPKPILKRAFDDEIHKPTVDKKLSSQNIYSRVKFVLEMITQQNSGSWPSALNGLMGSKQMLWSDPVTIQQVQVKQDPKKSFFYAYLNGKILTPGSKYRFRVKTKSVETELDVLPVSSWSNVLSFGHIAMVDPPRIKTVKPMSEGRIFLEWTFNPESRAQTDQGMNESMFLETQHMTTENYRSRGPAFVPDFFRILARPVFKPKSQGIFSFASSNSKDVLYGQYKSFDIQGPDARSGVINGLNQSQSYQVLIYASSGYGDTKQITQFSDVHYASLGTADIMSSNSKWDIFSNNKLMYIILASLAAFMLLVMLVLIIICCCRQKKSRKHRNNKDTYPFGYKENKSSLNFTQNPNNLSQMDQVDARLMAQGSNVNGYPNGTLMKMNSMDKFVQQQQAAEEYAASIAQAQAMQQQHQQAAMLLGSSLHLAQSPQQQGQQGNLFNSNGLPHHQSHQSLHINSMMMNNGGNGAVSRMSTMGPTNYHSGTLPINAMSAQNRYLMRQSSMNNGIPEQNQNGPPPPLPPPSQQMMYMPMGSSTLNRGMQMNHMASNNNLNTSHYGTTATSNVNHNRSKGEYGDLNALRNSSQMNNSQFEGMMPNQMGGGGAYFHGSQQHLAGQMATYGPGSIAMGSVIGGVNNTNPMHGNNRPFMNDQESIYSYFTQQQQQQQQNEMMMGTPGSMHPHLNPLPEENGGPYNENGQHYSDNNTLNNSATGSPAQPNGHKHHRRRRRKQNTQNLNGNPQQQHQMNMMSLMQGQQQGQDMMSDPNQSFNQYSLDNSNGNNNDNSNYQGDSSFNMISNSQSNSNYPPPPPVLSQMNSNQPQGSNCQSPLPPPNQPPPPPPAFSQQSQPQQQQRMGGGQSPQNVFQNLPRIRDYSEYGIPKNILPNS